MVSQTILQKGWTPVLFHPVCDLWPVVRLVTLQFRPHDLQTAASQVPEVEARCWILEEEFPDVTGSMHGIVSPRVRVTDFKPQRAAKISMHFGRILFLFLGYIVIDSRSKFLKIVWLLLLFTSRFNNFL